MRPDCVARTIARLERSPVRMGHLWSARPSLYGRIHICLRVSETLGTPRIIRVLNRRSIAVHLRHLPTTRCVRWWHGWVRRRHSHRRILWGNGHPSHPHVGTLKPLHRSTIWRLSQRLESLLYRLTTARYMWMLLDSDRTIHALRSGAPETIMRLSCYGG